ncbi:cytochrome c-type biogenesis protein [Alteriqipengyuania lutimaris]|uniref:Cytochrome c-type biogenesis protein n=1 Tax=Alteriqipengyuania lutimaris TaxID=1538146 RepID=A0A395LMX2_9SPHN|nr:cytochrome c-type biogenesis protein [Alteriqipengyuania lutimaris]MBB3032584.1 cytochrome c-type biogenesis protein CcmH [Alteriqipengyuania lutimaris]RDS78292.1 cytochrome c-type biogenesis protein CcmH [Alteriqipengyuania lutimaris]
MRPLALMVAALLALGAQGAAFAQGQAVSSAPLANVQLEDPQAEARAQELMEELRCLTCQSQSIADSDAPMAGDMRHQVRSRIAAGESPEDVRAWLVERYGDYVTYRPGLGAATWPLYALPLLFVLIALVILFRRLGRRGE